MTAVALVVGVVVGVACGGRLRYLTTRRVTAWWLLVPGVAVPLLIDHWDFRSWTGVGLVGADLCLLGFAFANRTLAGMGVVAVGLICNVLVIGVNGSMPVQAEAVIRAHLATPATISSLSYGHRHHAERPGDRLTVLDDRIPVPLFRQVFSPGDLIEAIGVAAVAANALQRRRSRPSLNRRLLNRRRLSARGSQAAASRHAIRPPLPPHPGARPGAVTSWPPMPPRPDTADVPEPRRVPSNGAGADGARPVGASPPVAPDRKRGLPPMPQPPGRRA